MDAAQFQRQIYEMLMESQYWPPEQMLEFQRGQLAQLLRHAKAKVPFYKTRLDCVLKENGDIDWDRWTEIPIVTKADLRDRRDEMLAKSLPPNHGLTKPIYTSGSSGVPIAIEVTQLWSIANRCAVIRYLKDHMVDTTGIQATFANFAPDGSLFKDDYALKKQGEFLQPGEETGNNYVINRNLPLARQLQLLGSLGVTFVTCFTQYIEVLARVNLQLDRPVQLDVISCFGQGVSDEQKSIFRRSFGARSVSAYSSKEAGLTACQCVDSGNFHVNAENVLLEILTEEGRGCSIGERGRVVVTPFFNTAIPLVRYELGDIAEFVNSGTCATTLPHITKIDGRQDQLLKLPDGPFAASPLKPLVFQKNLNAVAFQFAQVGPLKVEVRYIPAIPRRRIVKAPIIAHIHELVHPGLEIVFKPVDKIPLNPGGKQQRIVCEI
jgi:phenylacetate-CoA ligase